MRSAHSSKPSVMRRLVIAGAMAATLAGIAAAPALADDWGRRDDGWRHEEARREAWRHREWREREWREHEWRERHYAYGAPRYYYAPGYGYAPPPVVYPPPAYVEPGVNLGFYFR